MSSKLQRIRAILLASTVLTLLSSACSTGEFEKGVATTRILEHQTFAINTPLESPTPQIAKGTFNINSSIGNAEVGTKCSRLRIQNPNLKPGDKVQIVFTVAAPQSVVLAKIIDGVKCEEPESDRWPNLLGNQPDVGIDTYQLEILDKESYERGYGIAVVNFEKEIRVQNGLASVDLDGNGRPEFFRECTSNEGMHMTIWSGKPLSGKRIWHVYYHFPYDTEPTCDKREYK